MGVAKLQFEWDPAKAASNFVKHRVSFLTAAAIFENPVIERIDDREDYGEVRYVGLGRAGLDVYRVVYTRLDAETIRIISAQKAGRNEREYFFRQNFA